MDAGAALDGDREDRALLARIVGDDRIALEILYRRHAAWLTSRLQSRCGDPELVDIAVQDTFVAVWRSAKKFRGEGDVGAWVWGIAIRRLIDLLRKHRATPVDPSVIAATVELPVGSGIDDELVGYGDHGAIAQALGTLPTEMRAVFVATALDGLSTKEAARLFGVPQGTIKTRTMRARQLLRTALAEEALR